MALIDWILLIGYFVLSFGIAVYFFRRAGKNTGEFFLSGRNLPWWLAGTSMVATTFAADTPLAVTELVAAHGISGNWLWWNMALGGLMAVFFFAKLWRRSGILTDVEFVEVRYKGPAASWLRGIKAIFFGLVLNGIILGWVALAMETVIRVMFPELTVFGKTELFGLSSAMVVVAALILMVAVYSLLSGLWGVVVTDFIQFGIAMVGSILLAIFVLRVPEVGGMSGLMSQLPDHTFSFFPSLANAASGAGVLTLSFTAFFAYVGVQWWSSWYPGAEPGGGGYIAQRMMSAKDEKNATFATLWFTIAHYCLRPWPWIIVALASLVLYPNLTDAREGFVMVMRDVLPPGILGLMLAAFFAAFMSTFSTQLNWGTSYLVHDFWRRFIKTDGDERYYVMISRVFTFLLGLIAILITTQLDSISQAWGLVLTASGGLGLVLILRWYWWRINAWSELTATLVPLVLVVLSLMGAPVPGLQAEFPNNLFAIAGITTVSWLLVTFLTKPESKETLNAFYERVYPGGPGWKNWNNREKNGDNVPLSRLLSQWISGVVLVYATLFGTGYLLFDNFGGAFLMGGLAIGAGVFLSRSMRLK